MIRRTGEISTRIDVPQLSILYQAKGSLVIFALLCSVLTVAQAQRIYPYLDGIEVQTQLHLLSLGLLGLQEVILPAAMFVSAVFLCRKMWRRGYMLTLLTAGYSPWQLSRHLLFFSVLTTILVGVCAHVTGPKALFELRHRFTVAFESGQIYPTNFIEFGHNGALSILSDTKETVGVLRKHGSVQLFYAKRSGYQRLNGENWLSLKEVELSSDDALVETQRLNLKVPMQTVTAFPKVLRGSKLQMSSQLDLHRDHEMFAFVRRWALTVLPMILMLFALALPRVCSDGVLAFATIGLLGCVHLYFRGIELLSLSATMNVVSGVALMCSLLVLAALSMRRAFWRA